MSFTSTFLLPDLLEEMPIQGQTNPHYEAASAESRAWVESYGIFSDTKRASFVMGCNELLVSHTYPYAGYDSFRVICDFVNLLFVVDEITDAESGHDARQTGAIFVNAMVDSEWNDGSILAGMTRDFRARLVTGAGPNNLRRFVTHCETYIDAVCVEAELRESGEILKLESFIPLRRENSAVRLCFDLIEYAFGIDLPDTVFGDPTIDDIYWAACDIVCWSNDIYSYNVEQSKGHKGNNVTTVLMSEHNLDLQSAADFIGWHCKSLLHRVMQNCPQSLRDSSVQTTDVQKFIEGTRDWVRGNIDWSFSSWRYFGADHRMIKTTRLVTLLPEESPRNATSAGPHN